MCTVCDRGYEQHEACEGMVEVLKQVSPAMRKAPEEEVKQVVRLMAAWVEQVIVNNTEWKE